MIVLDTSVLPEPWKVEPAYPGVFVEIHAPPMNEFRVELWTDYGASGALAGSCPAVEAIYLMYEFDAGLTNGKFSVLLTNLGASMPLGPDTNTYSVFAGALQLFLSRVYLEPNSISVPEPGTLALLALGLVGLGVSRRREA